MGVPGGATAASAVAHPRRAVGTVVLLDPVGFGIVVPILPYYVRSFGGGDVFIGLLAATYSLTQFVAAPLLGRLSDRRGRRPVVALSLAGSAAWTAFGVTQGVGSLGRTVGPPVAAALYAVAYRSPFVAGAVVVLPVLAVLGGLVRRETRPG